jgi:hypothetical protein
MEIQAAATVSSVQAASTTHSAPPTPTPSYSPERFTPVTALAAVVDVAQQVADSAGEAATMPTPPDTGADAKLSAEISKLWGLQKDGNAKVQRTRAELKALRLELGEKLNSMKAILVRTDRGGGWTSYLRSQRIPSNSVDRYVAAHRATLAPPAKKSPLGCFPIQQRMTSASSARSSYQNSAEC